MQIEKCAEESRIEIEQTCNASEIKRKGLKEKKENWLLKCLSQSVI